MTDRDPSCLFCRIVAGEIPSDQVHAADAVVAFRDINPQAPTHVLVIPRRHVASVADLTDGDGELLAELFAAIRTVGRDLAGGYRVTTNVGRDAGQTVDHLHFHVMGGRAMTWPPG